MILTGSSNQMIFERFAGKRLHRLNNMFVTEDGTDGFCTSGIVSTATDKNQITFRTNNSIYVFSTADEQSIGQNAQTFFSLGSAAAAGY